MRYLLLVIACLCSIIQTSNANQLDSLKSIVNFNNDSIQIEHYLTIADAYFAENNIDSFGEYASKSLSISKKYSDQHLKGKALQYKGRYFGYEKELDSALLYLNLSLDIFNDLADSTLIASSYTSFSSAYFRSYALEDALIYSIKAIKIYEAIDESDELASALYNMALMFNRQRNYEKALEYLSKALAISESKAVSPKTKANILCYLARTYGNLYENEVDSTALDSTLKYAQIALHYSIENELESTELIALDVLYGYYYTKEDFGNAIELLDKTIEKSKRNNEKQLCTAYRRKSDLLMVLDRPFEAAILADSALSVAQRMDWKSHIMYSNKAIYESNKAIGNYPKAIKALEQYHQLYNEILNLKTTTSINELETKYQTEKKENTIKELEQKKLAADQEKQLQQIKINRQNWIIVGLILIAIIIGLIIWLINKQQKLKKDRLIIETKHKLLRSQMNPHFLFNGLTAVQRSIMKDESKIKSITHLSEFSRLMRSVLESSFNEFVTLENEIALLKNYLSLQRFRFDDDFEFNINVSDEIDQNSTLVPPMLLQPFLENSIEHGRGNTNQKLKVEILFSLSNDFLEIKIIDNGVGLSSSDEKNKSHISRALGIVQERLDLLQPFLRKKSNLEIINIADKIPEKSGVMVIILLPNKSNFTD